MRLLEFQAKRLLAKYGVPVPKGSVVKSVLGLKKLQYPLVLKAQVPVGGRGKAGAIRVCASHEEAVDVFRALTKATIKGCQVQAVLAEEGAEIKKELYLSVLLDKTANQPLVMTCPTGGIDIEAVASGNPDSILKRHLDSSGELPAYLTRYFAKRLGIDALSTDFSRILQQIYSAFRENDASLIEINPLAVTPRGLVALDAKVLLDDKAAYRHSDLFAELKAEQKLKTSSMTAAEQLAAKKGITYVPLNGDIGIISDGAGAGMLAVDLVHDAGGRAANFCELGGLAGAEAMLAALEVVHADPRVKVIIVGLIGGLTRMDEMADGIVAFLNRYGKPQPMQIRMCGTKEEAGKEKLRSVALEAREDLEAVVRSAVALVREM